MKKLTLILTIGLTLLTSCAVNTSSNIDIDPSDIVYFKDNRTNLCFGIVASRKNMSADATGLGLTCVPCDSVKHLLK